MHNAFLIIINNFNLRMWGTPGVNVLESMMYGHSAALGSVGLCGVCFGVASPHADSGGPIPYADISATNKVEIITNINIFTNADSLAVYKETYQVPYWLRKGEINILYTNHVLPILV